MKLTIIQDTIKAGYIAFNLAYGVSWQISPAILQAMRDWVSECTWAEDCETSEFSDTDIIRGVNRFFDGGLAAFFLSI